MNNPRRKEIDKAIELVAELRELIESIKDEEEEYKDNIPENMQSSDRYDRAETAVCELEEVCDNLDSIESSLENAKE